MGILARLFLLVVIALAPVTAIQIQDELGHRQARERELHAEALRLSTLVGMEQDRVLEGARQMLTTIAQLRSTGQRDPAAGEALLHRLAQGFPYYAYIATVDLQGHILCSSTGQLSGDNLLPNQPFFWAPLAKGDFAVGASAVMADGTRVLQLGYPIRDLSGATTGVALAGLRVDWLMSNLARDILPPNADLTITDRNGIIITKLVAGNPVAAAIGTALPPDRRALVHARAGGTWDGSDASGRLRIYGFDPVEAPPGEGVYIQVGLDRQSAFAGIDHSTRQRGLALGAALAIGAILSWLGFHYVVRRPVSRAVFVSPAPRAALTNTWPGTASASSDSESMYQMRLAICWPASCVGPSLATTATAASGTTPSAIVRTDS